MTKNQIRVLVILFLSVVMVYIAIPGFLQRNMVDGLVVLPTVMATLPPDGVRQESMSIQPNEPTLLQSDEEFDAESSVMQQPTGQVIAAATESEAEVAIIEPTQPTTISHKIDPAVQAAVASGGTAEVVINLLDPTVAQRLSPTELVYAIDAAQADVVSLLALASGESVLLYQNLPALAVEVDAADLALLAENGYVSYVQLDYELTAAAGESISEILGLSNANGQRTESESGEGVVIAIVDSGIQPGHEIFNGGSAIIHQECFLEDQQCEPGNHGTLMAAIVRDIAPQVELVDFQVLTFDGNGLYRYWLDALDRIIEVHDEYGIDIVNMSLATTTLFVGQCDSIYPAASSAIYQLNREGVTVIAAAGNDGLPGRTSSPACLNGVVSVGATYDAFDPAEEQELLEDLQDEDGIYNPPPGEIYPSCAGEIPTSLTLACFSNRDITLDILAPGAWIDVRDFSREPSYGTSQATAVTSGVASLLLGVNEFLTPAQFINTLRSSSPTITFDNIIGSVEVPVITGEGVATAIEETQTILDGFNCSDPEMTSIPQNECVALQTLYTRTNGDNWVNNTGWNQNYDPCEWYGVTCTGGHVTSLRLDRNGLAGNGGSTVDLPHSITNLTELVELRLSGNSLRSLPDAFTEASLPNLVEADFSYNAIEIYDVDTSVDTFLDRIDSDWRVTQTHAPASQFAFTETSTRFTVYWQPINYSDSPGRYEITCTQIVEPGISPIVMTKVTQTGDKSGGQMVFNRQDGVVANTQFNCTVQTISERTENHPYLESAESEVALASTRPEDVGNARVTLNPVEDIFISSTVLPVDGVLPDQNRPALFIGTYRDFTADNDPLFAQSEAFVRFITLPDTLQVENATLRVYQYASGANPDPVQVTSIEEAWSEGVYIRHAQFAGPGDLIFATNAPTADFVDLPTFISIELEENALQYLQDPTNNGLRVWIPGSPAAVTEQGTGLVICSSEPAGGPCVAGNEPTLEVVLVAAPSVGNPSPVVDALNVPVDTAFSWEAQPDAQNNAVTYNLYVGYSEDNLELVAEGLEEPSFAGIELEYGSQVYWRAESVDAAGNVSVVGGEPWRFWTTYCNPADGVAFAADCDALTKLAENTNGISLEEAGSIEPVEELGNAVTGQSAWMVNPVCEWYGVTCENGRVIGLQLVDLSLSTEDLSPVGDLTALRVLDLSGNNFNGLIPAEIGGLTQLSLLDLSRNALRGNIPSEMGNMVSLTTLNLANNRLNGELPTTLISLASLRVLSLTDNELDGDPFTAIATNGCAQSLSNLEELRLDQNLFVTESNLAGVECLTALTALDISHNGFGFEVPDAILSLPNLMELDIRYNRLEAFAAVAAQLDALQPGWEMTQSVPPAPQPMSPNDEDYVPYIDSIGSSGISLVWTPIEDFEGSGRYQVICALPDGVESEYSGELRSTPNLQSDGLTYGELFPGMRYMCEITTYILAHSEGGEVQKNDLISRGVLVEVEITTPDNLGNSITNPVEISEEDLPLKTIVDMSLYDTFANSDGDLDPPECVTDESGRQIHRGFNGGDGEETATARRATAEGRDGADAALAVIVRGPDGELIYISCVNNIEETDVSAVDADGNVLSGEDAVLDFYVQPGQEYFVIVMSETGSVGRIVFTLQDLSFRGCSDENVDVPEEECNALVDLYYNTNGPSWTNSDQWLAYSAICAWEGVTCSEGIEPHVIGLQLPANQMRGTLSSSFWNLASLHVLDLQYNELRGAIPALPANIELPELGNLNLSYNMLYATSTSPDLSVVRSDWAARMTVAPENIIFTPQESTSVLVEWTPIEYASGRGFYTVGYSTEEGGPYTFIQVDGDKNSNSLLVEGLFSETEYFFVIYTTSEEDLFFPRVVSSDLSAERLYVTPPNPAPIATNDSVTTNKNASVIIPVLNNDYDPEGEPLTVISTSELSVGRVFINADGTLNYTPGSDFVGTVQFSYTIQDPQENTSTALVTVIVEDGVVSENTAPDAQPDEATTDENLPVVIDVLANDTDADGDVLTIINIVQPMHGYIILNPDQRIAYRPDDGFEGVDTFQYTITDGNNAIDTEDVTVTVLAVQSGPEALDDMVTTTANASVIIRPLENDYSPDGQILTVTQVSQPLHGQVAVNADGSLNYTPAHGFVGTDTFVYTIMDEEQEVATATVTVVVTGVPPTEQPTAEPNEAPIATDDAITVQQGASVRIAPLLNDNDPDGDELEIISLTAPLSGNLTLNPNNTLTYEPNPGFAGGDVVTYTISDGNNHIATAVIHITVEAIAVSPTPTNGAPSAQDDLAETTVNATVVIPVLDNDSDIDGDVLTLNAISEPQNGQASINGDNTILYTPDPDFVGTDEFIYTVLDSAGHAASATVVITVSSAETEE